MKTSTILCLLIAFALSMVSATDVALKPADLKVSVLRYSPERGSMIIRFENNSHKPLRLLRPLDGSEWGWHMPIYELLITDEAGKSVPLGSRCGVSGLTFGMKWPDDYRFQILGGDAYEISVNIARPIPQPGRYLVTFRYIYNTESKDVKQHSSIIYPNDLWVGTAVSQPVAIDLPMVP